MSKKKEIMVEVDPFSLSNKQRGEEARVDKAPRLDEIEEGPHDDQV